MTKAFPRFGILFLLALAMLFTGAGVVHAQGAPAAFPTDITSNTTPSSGDSAVFQPLTDVSNTPFKDLFADTAGNGSGLTKFFNILFNVSITIGALLAVLELAYGGWEIMTTDTLSKRGDAKNRIQNALLGLLMLLATVLILNQINPQITSLKILQGGATQSSSAATTPAADVGFTTNTPYGSFCSTVGSGQYYCYKTAQACENTFGVNGCTSWSNSSAQTSITIPDAAASYDIQWNGTIADTQNSCDESLGSGWKNLTANYCGSSNTALGACCGLPRASPLTDLSQALNRYCFSSNSSSAAGYYCFADASTCTTYQDRSTAAGDTVVNTCAFYDQSAMGVLHQTTLPSNAADYSQFKWVNNAGKDAQGNLLRCSVTVGSGWTDVASNLCSGANSTPTGVCCALPKSTATGTPAPTGAAPVNETEYSTSDLTAIPNNRYCYRSPTTAFCTTTESQCSANESLYRQNNPNVTVQKCALFSK